MNGIKFVGLLIVIYLMMLAAALITGVIYMGNINISTWPETVRNNVATMPLMLEAIGLFLYTSAVSEGSEG